MVLPGREVSFRKFLRTLWRACWHDNLVDYAGSIAFSVVLAIFPFLLFAVALASVVVDPSALEPIIGEIRGILLPEVADLMTERLRSLTSESRTGLLTFGAAGAVWVASGAITAIMTAINTAYDVHESRPFWKTRALAVLLTFAAAVLFLAACGVAFVTPILADTLGGALGSLVMWLRWPIAMLILMLLVSVLYYLSPDVEQSFRLLNLGSIVAVTVWVLASLGFSYFIVHFGAYEVVYGALGSVIVLLMWVWISALAILFGAEINAVLDQLSPADKRRGPAAMARRGPRGPGTPKPARNRNRNEPPVPSSAHGLIRVKAGAPRAAYSYGGGGGGGSPGLVCRGIGLPSSIAFCTALACASSAFRCSSPATPYCPCIAARSALF